MLLSFSNLHFPSNQYIPPSCSLQGSTILKDDSQVGFHCSLCLFQTGPTCLWSRWVTTGEWNSWVELGFSTSSRCTWRREAFFIVTRAPSEWTFQGSNKLVGLKVTDAAQWQWFPIFKFQSSQCLAFILLKNIEKLLYWEFGINNIEYFLDSSS